MFGWRAGIGDPTLFGWMTVAAYALGAACCWWASARAASRERRFWQSLALVMALLCINKALNLQTLFTDAGRFEAIAHGWYGERQRYQILSILLATIVMMLIVSALLRRAKRASTSAKGAAVGLAVLLLFVLVRASSFHDVDRFMNVRPGRLRYHQLIELGSIAIVTAFALAATSKRGRRRLA